MLQLSSGTTYFMYQQVVDMRKGIHGLCGVVQNEMKLDLLQRAVFVFINRKGTTIKLLQWDGDGFALYEKKLARGTFEHKVHDASSASISLTHYQLQCILQGIILQSVRFKCRFGRQ